MGQYTDTQSPPPPGYLPVPEVARRRGLTAGAVQWRCVRHPGLGIRHAGRWWLRLEDFDAARGTPRRRYRRPLPPGTNGLLTVQQVAERTGTTNAVVWERCRMVPGFGQRIAGRWLIRPEQLQVLLGERTRARHVRG